MGYILTILSLVGVLLWYRSHLITEGENRKVAEDNKAVSIQKAQDDKILKEAENTHGKELQNLKADVSIHPLPPVRLCVISSGGLSEKGLPTNTGSIGGAVPEVPSGDNQVRGDGGSDISGMLDLLAQRADRLSADARELQAVAH